MTQPQHFVLLGDVGFVGAMGLRYRMTFIDEVNPDAVQKRSESCPPVLTDRTAGIELLFQHQQQQYHLQVSKLETRSKLLCGLDQLLVPMAASQGSVGHPHLCRRPCVLFLRGQCDDGKDCGFCHLHHERRPASLNRYQRKIVCRLPRGKFLLMLLPHFRRQAQVCESLGAERLLDVLKREIYLRSYFSIPDLHISGELHSVLRRMSLAALVSLACAHLGGPFPQLLLKELGNLREIAKDSEDFH